MSLVGKKQIVRTAEVGASIDAVWEVISDARLLPQWVPAVDAVTSCSADGEHVGASRTCSANLAGTSGTMVERCVEYTPTSRVAYVVDDETFGLLNMFENYGFSLNLSRLDNQQTLVTLETHYDPKNLVYATMNKAMMRRRFGTVCNDIVSGLKSFAEARVSNP